MNTTLKTFATTVLVLTIGMVSSASAEWWNPVIASSIPETTISQDPFWPHTHIHNHQTQVHASATAPFRNLVAPGSLRYINSTFYGADGALYRQVGYRWRNAVTGQPHSTVTTTRLTGGMTNAGLVTQSDSVTSIRSMKPKQSQPQLKKFGG
ncbi:MAG: hypothetical protein SGJ20_22135 [Planctomycetota bacterium]|nr:hypothetical protein [Planctomycetota bacterium]